MSENNDDTFDDPDFDLDDLNKELEYEMDPQVIVEKTEEKESARFAKFNAEDWWDGTLDSVENRIADLHQWSRFASTDFVRESASDQLKKLSEFRDEMLSRNYVDSLPGGMVEVIKSTIGEDDNTSLFAAAKAVEQEVQNYDWRHFISEGARQWIDVQPLEVVSNTDLLREAAYDYAISYTSMLGDSDSESVATKFVSNVEEYSKYVTCKIGVYLFSNRHGTVAVAANDKTEACYKYREATTFDPEDDFKRTAILNDVPVFGPSVEDFGGVEICDNELFVSANTERWGDGPYGFLFVR